MHSETKGEKAYLSFILALVRERLLRTEAQYVEFRRSTKQAFIEYDGAKDASLSYDEIAVQSALYYSAQEKYRGLVRAEKKPYFSRIDLSQEGGEKKAYYIGKSALIGDKNELHILDWRAPVASVYYDCQPGPVVYQAPEGEISAELFLKRQYVIEDGELLDITDIDITTNDELLQKSLSDSKDSRLRDIVTTIQAEQNAIIRADMWRPLIVQGAAGSGKTTIALHRIAYLIYTYAKSFHPDDFLIIAPSGLFLTYISAVLPELGVERVRQMTYPEVVRKLTGTRLKFTDGGRLEALLSGLPLSEKCLVEDVAKLKGSLLMRDAAELYVSEIERTFTTDVDFCVGEYLICPGAEIKATLTRDYPYVPVYKRLPIIKRILANRLKLRLPGLLEEVEARYDRRILRSREAGDRTRTIALMDERDFKLAELRARAKTALAGYLSHYPKKDLTQHMQELMTDSGLLMKLFDMLGGDAPAATLHELVRVNRANLGKKQIEQEDLPLLLYLRHKLFGVEDVLEVRSVIIDEAQDYSPFQFYSLKAALGTELFTILGDLAQGIHAYRSIDSWEEVTSGVFPKAEKLLLEQSYRTTIEIMEAANKVIAKAELCGVPLAKPVVRHGEAPKRIPCAGGEVLQRTAEEAERLISAGHKTVAVICRTAADCKKLQRKLPMFTLIGEKQTEYGGGLVLLPAHLSKGLEFDAVIVAVPGEPFGDSVLERKLLYVAMTRALHELVLIGGGFGV